MSRFDWPKEDTIYRPVPGGVAFPMGWRQGKSGRHFHEGLDMIAREGEPIRAGLSGYVNRAGEFGGYGLLVSIMHEPRNMKGKQILVETRYAHMSRIAPGVKPGKWVTRGQVIGWVGNTGLSDSPHLHFELRIGPEAVDPLPYMDDVQSVVASGFIPANGWEWLYFPE